jgi:hypothetical protein
MSSFNADIYLNDDTDIDFGILVKDLRLRHEDE